jgi:transcriptional regulator with XRE-family HTH domain
MGKLPNRIRETRHRLGVSLDDLARKSGLHASTLSRLELGGRKMSELYFTKIAKALNVPVSELHGEATSDNGNGNGKHVAEPLFVMRGGFLTIEVTVDLDGLKRLREQLDKFEALMKMSRPAS